MSRTLNEFLDANGLSSNPEDDIEHYGVKGMKWGNKKEDQELAKLANQAQTVTNANAKALAYLKIGNNLFDKKSFYLIGSGAKFVKNSLGGKELTYKNIKAKEFTKQGAVNRFIENIFNRNKKKQTAPKFDNRPIIKGVGPQLKTTPSAKLSR